MKQVLSDEQKAIAFHNDCEGAMVVEAAAGSGKTRILTERVRYLLTEKKDKFFSVLCLTFTNKAAEEMKQRLEGTPNLKERAFIGTFHEFCLEKIMRHRYHEIGLSALPHIFDENDQKKIIEEVLYSNESLKSIYEFPDIPSHKERANKQRERLAKCANFISEAKRKLTIVPEFETAWKNWGELNTYLYREYNRRLISQNAMDYDDILLYAYQIITGRPSTASIFRRTYQYILVDEAQDMNYAQYQVIRAICGEEHRNVMMVGDPKQAIYGFNGSSAKFMQDYFVQDFQAAKREIRYNYRSSQRVLELAQNIQPNGGIGTNYYQGVSEIHSFENEAAEAEWIIQTIKFWISEGKYHEAGKEEAESIGLRNIAVLARNKFVFSALMEQLDKDNSLKGRYYLRKGIERFEPESALVKVFDLGLRLLVNPADVLHYRQLVYELGLFNLPPTTDSKAILANLDQFDSPVLTKPNLRLLTELWSKLERNPKWLGGAIGELQNQLRDRSFLREEAEYPKVDFDLKELSKYWGTFARKEASENHNLSNFRYFLALNGSRENKEELLLASVHMVKGLEFDIVFLIGMCDGVFPDFRANNEQSIKEERNNAYVAVTRARRCIYITWPQVRMMPWGAPKVQKPSRFIKGLPLSIAVF
ncbi:MAG: ATP-dependent helicase [Saprospiraceae bacterium]